MKVQVLVCMVQWAFSLYKPVQACTCCCTECPAEPKNTLCPSTVTGAHAGSQDVCVIKTGAFGTVLLLDGMALAAAGALRARQRGPSSNPSCVSAD